MGTTRGDWQISDKDSLMMRYSIEQLNATGANTLDRGVGSASQRQVLENKFQAFVTTWTHVITPNLLNRFSFAENNFFNNTTPVAVEPQIDLPSLPGGCVVPRAAADQAKPAGVRRHRRLVTREAQFQGRY